MSIRVATRTHFVRVTLSLPAEAQDSGDVLADTQVVTGAFRDVDGAGILQAVTVFDADDQTAYDFDIYVLRTSTSLGTEDAAISITDANLIAAEPKRVAFTSDDAADMINGIMYQRANLGLPVRAAAGTKDLYIAMVSRGGTPTHSASGVVVELCILLD